MHNLSPISRSLEGSATFGLSRNHVGGKMMTKFGYVPEVVVSEHPVPGILETSEADGEEIKLERANRDLMEKTVQNYLIFDTSTPFKVNC